jgi:hypothetical protein
MSCPHSGPFKEFLGVLGVIKKVGVKVLAVLEHIFHGGCRRVSRVLSLTSEAISKSTVHELAKVVSSKVIPAPKPFIGDV